MAEKRLIDANRALEIVRDQGIAHPNAYHLTNYATLILREAPTVDAVEVVRCKDCTKYDAEDLCPLLSKRAYTLPDDFCCYWERRTDG